MTDTELIFKTEILVNEERAILSQILQNLREIDRRKAFSTLKYKSLFDFATKHLKYSEDQAYARINAMKLVKELPSVEGKIKTGELTITHMVHAKRLFNKEKFSKEEKLEVFEQISGKTTRETERIVLSFATKPESLTPDRIRHVTNELTELKFVVDQETLAKLEEFKGLCALKLPNASLGDLLKSALELAIAKAKSATPKKRRIILEKTDFKCENCGSNHAPEVDHVIPTAKGGEDTPENSRALCRNCNLKAAINEFGQRHMDQFTH